VDNPVVGDLVSVKALRQSNGELWAKSITPIRGTEVQIDGTIEGFGGDSITVDGQTMTITSETQINGTPEVGRRAQVRALQMPDGSLIALVIVVIEPTPTDTPEPTASPTVAPTDTATVEPTATETVAPTATETAAPTATDTVAPMDTATSEPTATPTP
jgi:hypothetical protein